MMKKISILIIGLTFLILGCKEGYIDEITKVDPGADEAAPEITLSYPTGNISIPFTETETDIEFAFGASDDIELASLSVNFNGTELASYDEFVDYRKSSQTYLLEDVSVGTHTVEITATDLEGKTTTETLEFEVTNQYTAMDGEVFYMPFEGESYLDLIGNVEGTPYNSPTFVSNGAAFEALHLDVEDSSYVLIPGDVLANLENFTLSFWVRTEFVDSDENGGIDGILGYVNLSNIGRFWGNLNFFVENNSNPTDGADMRIMVANGVDAPTYSDTWITSVNDVSGIFGSWSNHVLTYDNTSKEFKYFINGEVMTTVSASWDTSLQFQDSGPIVLGCVHFMTDPSLTSATGAQGWASYLTGELDEVRIFNKALTETEVTDLYSSVSP